MKRLIFLAVLVSCGDSEKTPSCGRDTTIALSRVGAQGDTTIRLTPVCKSERIEDLPGVDNSPRGR